MRLFIHIFILIEIKIVKDNNDQRVGLLWYVRSKVLRGNIMFIIRYIQRKNGTVEILD